MWNPALRLVFGISSHIVNPLKHQSCTQPLTSLTEAFGIGSRAPETPAPSKPGSLHDNSSSYFFTAESRTSGDSNHAEPSQRGPASQEAAPLGSHWAWTCHQNPRQPGLQHRDPWTSSGGGLNGRSCSLDYIRKGMTHMLRIESTAEAAPWQTSFVG